jgi:hypothetical protein
MKSLKTIYMIIAVGTLWSEALVTALRSIGLRNINKLTDLDHANITNLMGRPPNRLPTPVADL